MTIAYIQIKEDPGLGIVGRRVDFRFEENSGAVFEGNGSIYRIDIAEYKKAFPLHQPTFQIDLQLVGHWGESDSYIPPDLDERQRRMMTLPLVPIVSSNIHAAGFDPLYGTLVQFKSGEIYRYPTADRVIYDGLLAAESAGKYQHAVLRKLPYEKLT